MNQQVLPELNIDLSQYGRNDTVEVIHAALTRKLREPDMGGYRLVPVRQFAQKLGVARQTIQKVYCQLEEEGIISRMPGKRTWSIARSQKTRPRCFGMVLPIPFSEYFLPETEHGQRHFRMYAGIIDRATELGYSSCPVFLPPGDASEEAVAEAIMDIKQRCCAVIHFGSRGFSPDLPLQRLLQQQDIAQISFNCEFTYPNVGAVTFDPDYAARMAITYLRESGHRNICLVYCLHEESDGESKYVLTQEKDLREKFENAGVPSINLSFFPIKRGKEVESLRRNLTAVLEQDMPPTAFWCRNDSIAFDLIRLLQKRGLRVPDDFSVIGFNNLLDAEQFNPPLSTFNNPFYDMGQTVTNRLHEYITKGITLEHRITRIPPLLISRGSVGPVRSRFFSNEKFNH